MINLSIFISSPGDVDEERRRAARVIKRLQGEFVRFVKLTPILWEQSPKRATEHFQEQIILPSQTDIAVCILWSRLGTRLPSDKFRRPDGTPYLSGTEFEFEEASRAYREKGTPDLLVYKKTAKPTLELDNEDLVRERLVQKKAFDAFWNRWFGNPNDSFKAGFNAFETADQFEKMLEEHLREKIRERLPKSLADEPVTISWTKDESPYRGLQVFDMEHAEVFFGRRHAVNAVIDALVAQSKKGCAFLTIFGVSGCGKSSLVRAGILPTLLKGGIEGTDIWRCSIFRPGDAQDRLLGGLVGALLRESALPEFETVGYTGDKLASLLSKDPQSIDAPLPAALQQASQTEMTRNSLGKPPTVKLVLVVDQLEEMFTMEKADAQTRIEFVKALAALAHTGLVWVICTMRSDFYPRCAEIPELIALKEGLGQYDLLPPTVAEIGDIIRYPAYAAGLKFEKREDGKRLDDVLQEATANNPNVLPLLEFALDQLYENRNKDLGIMTFSAYEKMKGLEGALADHAEEIFNHKLSPAEQEVMPSVFLLLVTLGQGGEDVIVNRRVPFENLATTPERRALVNAFIEGRLLTTDRSKDGQTVVSVVHESLILHWPRLNKLLENDREFLRLRTRISDAIVRWKEEGKPTDLLLPKGILLTKAREVLSKRCNDLCLEEISFIETSIREIKRKKTWKIAVASAIISLLIGGGLGCWDIYYREHIEYYANFAKRWGVPKGIERVSKKIASHRNNTFKFYCRGHLGVITRVEAINGYGELNTRHSVGSFIAGWKTDDDPTRECIWEFEPKIRKNDRDYLVNEIARNSRGETCWIFHFRPHKAESNTYLAEYTNEIGRQNLRGYSSASLVEFVRTKDGFDELIRYYDEKGNPQPDNDGSFGIQCIFNKHGQPTSNIYLNFDGKPVLNKYGFAIEKARYDERGNIVEAAFFDETDKPIRRTEGLAIMKSKYDKWGNQTEQAYFDEADKPIRLKDGYAIVKMEYDERGNQTEQAYFDEADKRIRLKDGYAIVKLKYDELGNQTEQTYFDETDKPIRRTEGIAIMKSKYDKWGNQTEEAYFDETDNPMRLKNGYAIVKMKYDEHGNQTEQAYFDEKDKRIRSKDGYAIWRAEYDEQGNTTEVAYFDEEDKRIRHKDGNAIMKRKYDDRGNLTEEAYFDETDNPMRLKNGYAIVKMKYDEHGNQTEQAYFDEKDKRIRSKDGYAIWRAEYDEQGNTTEVAYFDEEDKRIRHKDGNAIVKRKYDDRGNLTEVAYFDGEGKRIPCKDGYAIAKMEYDERGNITEEAYFDKEGKRIRCTYGFAIERMEHDERGNIVKLACFDEEDKRIRSKDGYAIRRSNYDERGNITKEAFFDETDQPIRRTEGFAIAKMEYDERGNTTEEAYFDEADKPIRRTEGFARMKSKYDKWGNQTEQAYFDEEDKRIRSKDGYAIRRSNYDERGNITKEAYFDETDNPTRHKKGYATVRWKYDKRDNQIEDVLYLDTNGRKVLTNVIINAIIPDGQGEKIGLQPGDIIVSYDGKKVTNFQALIARAKNSGVKLRTLDIIRNGEKMGFQVSPGLIGILLEDIGVSASR